MSEMTPPAAEAARTPIDRTRHGFPAELRPIVGPAALTRYEQRALYDACEAAVLDDIRPRNLIEHIWTAAVVDHQWEVVRWSNVKRVVLELSRAAGAYELFAPGAGVYHLGGPGWTPADGNARIAEDSANGGAYRLGTELRQQHPELSATFGEIAAYAAQKAGLEPNDLLHLGHRIALPELEHVEAHIARHEQARDKYVREIERRRDRQARSAPEDEGEVIDAEFE